MIHELLLKLNEALPLYPPLVVGGAAILIIGLTLWLFGRSRGTVLFAVSIALLAGGLVVGLVGVDRPVEAIRWGDLEDLADRLIGPDVFRRWEQIAVASVGLGALLLVLLYKEMGATDPAERQRRRLARDKRQGQALGSAELCSRRTFRRWSRPDAWGWTLQGRFWGTNGQQLGKRLCLSGEDIARGVAVFGPQGTGKTQSVILPAIADRMRDGHSLVVTDPQGELQPTIQRIAARTGHAVVVHNPSDPAGSCALNLCDWINSVADAQAMAAVLLSGTDSQGENSFWHKAATNLLAACILHYPTLGAVMDAGHDLEQMARDLKASQAPGAADLAARFVASMGTKDPRLALNIVASAFETGLSPWADRGLRAVTNSTDLDLVAQMTSVPTVVILRCARRHTASYGPYLGAVLRVLTSRLDDLGEQSGGALPVPVGLILEEFPALGRLDSLVRDINLVRKRRISVLTAAQSLAQLDHIYPARGETDRLLAGLATKIVFGGCDGRTAEFFSQLSGQQTLALASMSGSGPASRDGATASLRSRALLLADDLIRPAKGHATVFAAYSENGRSDQAIFHARLTPFHRRRDWKLERVVPERPVALPEKARRERRERMTDSMELNLDLSHRETEGRR
jgi:type IV secretory pathway TraG/TraD family ATPase VirD4